MFNILINNCDKTMGGYYNNYLDNIWNNYLVTHKSLMLHQSKYFLQLLEYEIMLSFKIKLLNQ